MSNSNRGPSIDASYHVSVHLAKLLQRRRFLEIDQSETLLPVAAMFVNDRDKMSNLYRGPPIDASYQVSVHLAKRFQKRRFFRNHPIRNKNCLWWLYLLTDRDQNEQSQQRTFHRCFLPSFSSFGQTVSEEKNLICSIVFYFLLFFSLIFKFEERQRPCLMAVGIIILGLKENYICIVPL
jgi:hypothetical protein